MIQPGTKYGLRYIISMFPGDGVGRELCSAVQMIFSALKVPIDWDYVDCTNSLTPAIDSLARNRIALKGIFHTSISNSRPSFNLALRKHLDIYANIVHLYTIPCVSRSPLSIDMVLIRENTEGEYSGLEHEPVPGVVESLKVITRHNSERIVKFAFDYALMNGRRKVTCVHKANIMKLSDGLFLNTFREIAQQYRSIEANDMIVDNTAMQLVSNPQQFDVVVAPNLYGNIVTNIGAGLVGGPGLIPGYNIGRDYATFEPGARHVGKDLEGRNQANPISMILSSCLMLRHLGLDDYATRINDAVNSVVKQGRYLTPDMNGSSTTTDVCAAVINCAQSAAI